MIGPTKRQTAPTAHEAMNYMMLPPQGQHQILDQLASMTTFLAKRFGALADYEATIRVGNLPSPVEQVWHLADLERERPVAGSGGNVPDQLNLGIAAPPRAVVAARRRAQRARRAAR